MLRALPAGLPPLPRDRYVGTCITASDHKVIESFEWCLHDPPTQEERLLRQVSPTQREVITRHELTVIRGGLTGC